MPSTITDITEKDLTALKASLREKTIKWVDHLCKQIMEAKNLTGLNKNYQEQMKQIPESDAKRKIYNSFSGVIRDKAFIAFIYSQGNHLLLTLSENLEQAKS